MTGSWEAVNAGTAGTPVRGATGSLATALGFSSLGAAFFRPGKPPASKLPIPPCLTP